MNDNTVIRREMPLVPTTPPPPPPPDYSSGRSQP